MGILTAERTLLLSRQTWRLRTARTEWQQTPSSVEGGSATVRGAWRGGALQLPRSAVREWEELEFICLLVGLLAYFYLIAKHLQMMWWWTGETVGGNGRGLIWDTILRFAWRQRGNPRTVVLWTIGAWKDMRAGIAETKFRATVAWRATAADRSLLGQ